MKFAFNIHRGSFRHSKFIQTGINLKSIAFSRSKRCKFAKNFFCGIVAFTVITNAEYSGSNYFSVVRICMNRNMEIGTKVIRLYASILHCVVLTNFNFNSVSFKSTFACNRNLSTLNIFSCVSISISIFVLIRRREINFFSHHIFILSYVIVFF